MTCQYVMQWRRTVARTLFLCAALVPTLVPALCSAGEADARRLLKTMSDDLAARTAISFDFDTSLDIVSTQQQTITLAASASVVLNRPDKLHVTRRGGFANIEMSFDGLRHHEQQGHRFAGIHARRLVLETGAKIAADPFRLTITPGTQKLTPEKVQELSDIPGIFKSTSNDGKGTPAKGKP